MLNLTTLYIDNSFICKIDLTTGVAKLLNPRTDPNGWGYWKSVAVDPNSTKVVYVSREGITSKNIIVFKEV